MDVDLKQVDKGKVKSFLMFDLLLLPVLARAYYVLGSVAILLGGLAYPFIHATGMRFSIEGIKTGFDFGAFVVGILISAVMTPLWLLGLRIASEAAVLLFEIHGALVPKRPVRASAPPPAAAPSPPPEPLKPEPPPAAPAST